MNIRSEDSLIFSALTPKATKMGLVYKALAEFCSKKQSLDLSDRFNIILFQKDGPSYLDNFTLNPRHILSTLKSLEKKTIRGNIAGGIFVAITFIIDVFKKISEKVFRLIILTDRSSLQIPDHYVPVLNNLIEKVKDMPFFMDIIRIRINDPEEDFKLMKLAKKCGGKLYDVKNLKKLPEVFNKLAEKKVIQEREFYNKNAGRILKSNQPFFENLADEALSVEEETCSVCFKKDVKGLVKCLACDTVAHKSCWSFWAKTSNIGIPNVFRCHNCFNLLKIDRQYVLAIQAGEDPEDWIKQVQTKGLLEHLKSIENKDGPEIIQVEDPLSVPMEDIQEYDDSQDYKDIVLEVKQPESFPKSSRSKRNANLSIVFCPNCSKISTSDKKTCPSCHFPLKS